MEKINICFEFQIYFIHLSLFQLCPIIFSLSSSFHCLYINGHLVRRDSNFYGTEAIFTGLVNWSDEPSETLDSVVRRFISPKVTNPKLTKFISPKAH